MAMFPEGANGRWAVGRGPGMLASGRGLPLESNASRTPTA